MKAYTYLGIGKAGLVDKPMPKILKPEDAIAPLYKKNYK